MASARLNSALLLGLLIALAPCGAVRETDVACVFINIPVEPDVLQSYLSPELRPNVVDGSAWLTINPFVISSLESEVLGHRFEIPGLSGPVVKTVAHVTKADGTQPGYMIIDMDFGPGLAGWSMFKGCRSTQHGAECRQAASSSISTSSVAVRTSDGLGLSVQMEDADGVDADAGLASLVLDAHWKYLQLPDRSFSAGNQTGRAHRGVRAVRVTGFRSDLLSRRHGWRGEEAPATLCQPVGTCFYASWLQFVDGESSFERSDASAGGRIFL